MLLLWRLNLRPARFLPIWHDTNPYLQCQQQLQHRLDRTAYGPEYGFTWRGRLRYGGWV